jgi:hypothetical protein
MRSIFCTCTGLSSQTDPVMKYTLEIHLPMRKQRKHEMQLKIKTLLTKQLFKHPYIKAARLQISQNILRKSILRKMYQNLYIQDPRYIFHVIKCGLRLILQYFVTIFLLRF